MSGKETWEEKRETKHEDKEQLKDKVRHWHALSEGLKQNRTSDEASMHSIRLVLNWG